MAWNEPGGSGNKDPWGNRNDNQGPPDLDEVFKKVQDKVSSIFGGGKGGSKKSSGGGGGLGASFIAIVLLSIWALSGIYIIDEGKEGVVLQFGKFNNIAEPGPHWYPRFIQSVYIVNTDNVRAVVLGRKSSEALMLTKDENIVDVEFTVQYKIKDAKNFLFNVRDPDTTVVQATESAMRENVGKATMDSVIKDGRLEIAGNAKKLIQEILDRYKAGILITNVNMQNAQPPEQVQYAFDDAIKAREDRERKINEAEAYSNDILPRARGKGARIEQDALAYRDEIIAKADGEAQRFTKLLVEYRRAPRVTRERLYLETMEEVYTKTNKVMIDVKQGNSLMYLPIDKIISQRRSGSSVEESTTDINDGATSAPSSSRFDSRSRSREVR
ncbi:HflK protein [hydrothermal vent metagenome]|uniref:HflK protein n=1 Tax=hydrothermal vent metagenome TaxID=652676 RepID=A0A3B1A324_9ZZZZ